MKITKNTVVTIDYSIADTQGGLLDGGAEPLVYIHGLGGDYLPPKIESALEGKSLGDSVDMTLAPEEGFGEYDETLVEVEELKAFGQPLEVGMQFSKDDGEDALIYEVTQKLSMKIIKPKSSGKERAQHLIPDTQMEGQFSVHQSGNI